MTPKDLTMYRQTLALLVLLSAAPFAAQQPSAQTQRTRAPAVAPEDLLRIRSLLDLSNDQVTKLQALRKEAVEARRAEMGRMLEFRSQIRAGEIAWEDARKTMLDQRTEIRKGMEARQAQLNAMLTDTQREKLQTLRREMWMRRGATGGRPGRGGMWGLPPSGRGQWRHQSVPPGPPPA